MSTSINECEVCLESAKLQCPGCKTHYCSTECQKAVWYVHKHICGSDKSFIRQPDLVREEIHILVEIDKLERPHLFTEFELDLEQADKDSTSAAEMLETQIDIHSALLDRFIRSTTPYRRTAILTERRNIIFKNDFDLPLVVSLKESLYKKYPYLKILHLIMQEEMWFMRYAIETHVHKEVSYLNLLINTLQVPTSRKVTFKFDFSEQSPLVNRYINKLDELINLQGKNYSLFIVLKENLILEIRAHKANGLLLGSIITKGEFDTIIHEAIKIHKDAVEKCQSSLKPENFIKRYTMMVNKFEETFEI